MEVDTFLLGRQAGRCNRRLTPVSTRSLSQRIPGESAKNCMYRSSHLGALRAPGPFRPRKQMKHRPREECSRMKMGISGPDAGRSSRLGALRAPGPFRPQETGEAQTTGSE
eukprot:1159167-Pelagomonas_calceolata.AAC.5